MEQASPSGHLCYVRCAYCSTVLAVGVPYKRIVDTVTVTCGHCNSISFLDSRPLLQPLLCSAHHHPTSQQMISPCDYNMVWNIDGQQYSTMLMSSSPKAADHLIIRKAPASILKPPEKKHRLPSAYNHFMREEIRRIKDANPEIPHREAFSAAAKNWAKGDSPAIVSSTSYANGATCCTTSIDHQNENTNELIVKRCDIPKQPEHNY